MYLNINIVNKLYEMLLFSENTTSHIYLYSFSLALKTCQIRFNCLNNRIIHFINLENCRIRFPRSK